MFEFHFQLGDPVKLRLSNERGIVIGRAEYAENNPSYYVRFVAADGRQVEDWFNSMAISLDKPDV